MEELISRMNALLASSYMLYLKSSFYHWNVKHPDFPMYHQFFGDLYQEIYESIDDIAEHIRQLNGIPANSPSMLTQNSFVEGTTLVVPAPVMVANLYSDVNLFFQEIVKTNELAERFSEIGLANFLQDRHAALKKHAWMLRSMVEAA